MLRECQQADVAKNVTNKKKKGKEAPKTKGNQEEFEAMKKKTKNMLMVTQSVLLPLPKTG